MAELPRRLAAGAVAVLVALTAACTSEPPDPAEVRREQVRQRLEASFSDAQATCILDALDEPTIEALAGTADLGADDERFVQYSNVVLLCTRDSAAAATTTTEAPTTEAPTSEAPTTTGG